jgi:hypothetical protein
MADHNPDRDTWGRRCEIGCEDWPDTLEYRICPRCDGETTRFSNLRPLSAEDARSIKSHIEFNAYYEQRCTRLKIPVSGPLPAWYETRLESVAAPSG